jgi:hypothetical protein
MRQSKDRTCQSIVSVHRAMSQRVLLDRQANEEGLHEKTERNEMKF